MTDFRALLTTLVAGGVKFILVGGLAGAAHGASRLTQDVDVVYARDPGNLRRPVRSLDLPKLIDVKRAAGRPKDLEAIAELEVLLEERLRRP